MANGCECSEEPFHPRKPCDRCERTSGDREGCCSVSIRNACVDQNAERLFFRAGAFPSDEIPDVVLSLVLIGLDISTSNDLRMQLNMTMDAVCNHDAQDLVVVRAVPVSQIGNY